MAQNKKILLIDDNNEVGRTVGEVLFLDYEDVTFVEEPEAALALLKNQTYSLILVDIQMPRIPGTELTRLIRKMGVMTPIVFLTGLVTKEVVLTALRLGVADVIEKGTPTADFLATVARILEIEDRRHQYYLNQSGHGSSNQLSHEDIENQRLFLGQLQVAKNK